MATKKIMGRARLADAMERLVKALKAERDPGKRAIIKARIKALRARKTARKTGGKASSAAKASVSKSRAMVPTGGIRTRKEAVHGKTDRRKKALVKGSTLPSTDVKTPKPKTKAPSKAPSKKTPSRVRGRGKGGLLLGGLAAAGAGLGLYQGSKIKEKVDQGREAMRREAERDKAKKTPPKTTPPKKTAPGKKSPVVRGKDVAVTSKIPRVNVYKAKLDAASKMKGPEGIQAKEAAIAGFATILAGQVPGVAKTADSIAGVLGRNLKSLGLAGLGAGTVYLIAKELAAHRKSKPSPTATGIRKGLKALKGDNKKRMVTGYRPSRHPSRRMKKKQFEQRSR